MAEARETRAFYKAIADFANLRRELSKVRTDLAKTKAAEKAFNENSAKSWKARQTTIASTVKLANTAIAAQNRHLLTNAKRLTAATAAAKEYAAAQRSIGKATGVTAAQIRAQKDYTKAQKDGTSATREAKKAAVEFVEDVGHVNQATGEVTQSLQKSERAVGRWSRAFDRGRQALVRFRKDGDALPPIFRRLEGGAGRLYRSLEKFGNWRPRLIPPFVALVPAIGAVVAALNPLVALLGAVGGAAIGLVGNIGSLSGAFLALPGILSAVVGGISAVIASMGGVGNVFKTYSAMQKALGKSPGSGQTQAERADALADAEQNLAKAQRNVTKAQEGLNKAREEALRDLIALRTEVGRASMTEERAIADLQLAREAYNNVMADPGSTAGEKLDAAVEVKEAEAALEDVRRRNAEAQKELTEAERKGIAQSDKVLDAQENLADALRAQRDAQKALRDQKMGGTGAAQAVNEFNAALNELSPSARKFVLALIAMQAQWKAFRRDIQESFFSQFTKDLSRLPRILTTIGNFLRPAAVAMGQFTSNFLALLDSPAWRRDLGTIGDQNATVIENLGGGALRLADALKDLIIAAGPFTEWMTNGFKEGSDNFADLIANARETGSLANWLSKVETRLRKWWDIVKNIGATIFNYSAAASEFGDWMSDGVLEMTENWRKASENAREPGSAFGEWLEKIKTPLSEVDRLLGSFFGWFAREANEQGNIDSVANLLKILTDNVGPALGRLFDTLAATNIDEKLLLAITSIIESLDTLLENGGASAFEGFFDIVTTFFSAMATAFALIPKPILEGVLTLIGMLAGITFVGKFTGLTFLLGQLLGFTPAGLFGLTDMFKNLKGLDKLKFLGAIALFTALAAVAIPAAVDLVEALGNAADVDKKERSGAYNREGGTYQRLVDLYGSKEKADEVIAAHQSGPLKWLDDLTGGGAMWTPEGLNKPVAPPKKRTRDEMIQSGSILDPAWWQALFGGDANNIATSGGDINKNWDQAFKDIGKGWGKGILNDFATNVSTEWNNFWRDLGAGWGKGPLNTFFSDVGKKFQTGWTQITTWFDQNVGSKFERGWKQITNWWTIELPRFFGDIGSRFRTGWEQIVTGIGTVWTRIQNAFATPVNWVLTNVWNNGIVKFWNGIAKTLGLPTLGRAGLVGGGATAGNAVGGAGAAVVKAAQKKDGGVLKFAGGGVLPGYTPGRDVHDFFSPTGGRLSLSGGEAIMRPEFTKLVGGKAGVDAINKKVRNGEGLAAFANGGVYGKYASKKGKKDSGGDVGANVAQALGAIFQNPVKAVGDGLRNIVNPMLAGLGNTLGGRLAKAIPNKIIGSLERAVGSVFSTTGGAANNMGWQKQWAVLKRAFPYATLNSAYRPGSRTVNGSVSYHASGRAIDTTPSMEIFNWIRQNYPNSRELIYSPAGGRQLRNGANYFWGEPVRSQHFSHVHWAMKNGGVFDNGGWMRSGQAAFNFSGKPEAVLTNEESRGLKSLVNGVGLGGSLPSLGAAPAGGFGRAASVVDNSINVGQLVMNNPVPEKPSTSLAKGIRNLAYMQSARSDGSDS